MPIATPFKPNFTDSPFYTNKDGAEGEATPKPVDMPNQSHGFIKDESADQPPTGRFNGHDFSTFSMSPSSHGQQPFSSSSFLNSGASVDPSELTRPTPSGGNSFGFQSFGGNNFSMLSSGGVTDDDLLASLSADPNEDLFAAGQIGPYTDADVDQYINSVTSGHSQSVPVSMGQMYSSTPDNPPSASPFIRPPFQVPGSIRQQLQQHHSYQGNLDSPSPYTASPLVRSSSSGIPIDMERVGSNRSPTCMSPRTPKTPAIGGLSISTGDSSSLPPQPIQNHHLGHHRQQKSISGTWDGNSGSLSYIESPLSSPGHASHPGIVDMLKSGKHASLPSKVDGGPATSSTQNFQTQEAKRRRRRESHNMVERRRRDNINERIQELSHLVPQHRLEDERVRKHLVNNSPLSPSIAGPSGSPPRATSGLAGGIGRRASGVASAVTSMPSEEKDKGPNKGDILNGAVGWTRDLMWALHKKVDQEKKLKELIIQLGGTFPFESTEEDKRMEAEIESAIKKNGSGQYSRGPGSGLRVPNYTDLAGAPLTQLQDPRPGRAGVQTQQSGQATQQTSGPQPQYWPNPATNGSSENASGVAFKEEEEYNMDMS